MTSSVEYLHIQPTAVMASSSSLSDIHKLSVTVRFS